ncbi:MAG: helix-turn-helix domain-containing protein [Oscillospiraceae bacterium]|nr:helix-turn-helix domain-containing protein [Oscillospiraceae bacterium]
MTIGETLKNMRLRNRRTLKEQSVILGVSVNSVYRWEHDLALPRKSALVKMAKSYGISVERLLQGSIADADDGFGEAKLGEDNIEQHLLSMFRKLSYPDKYRILGHVERICVEEMDEDNGTVLRLFESAIE